MSASELTPPSYSSAEKSQNSCDIASEGEYLGPIAGFGGDKGRGALGSSGELQSPPVGRGLCVRKRYKAV